VVDVPDSAGVLTMKHCTVVATTPAANAGLLFSQADKAYTMNLDNNILAMVGSTVGIIHGSGTNASGTVGKNLRWYGGSVPAGDDLTGTIVDADPLLKADNIHISAFSPANEAAVVLSPAVTKDIDGEARPQPGATNPDLGADEGSGPVYLDVGSTATWPYATIQAAYAAAAGTPDEVIRVHDGTYKAPPTWAWNKDVNVIQEAPGETAVYAFPEDVDSVWGILVGENTRNRNLTWDGIDILINRAIIGPFLVGGHSPATNTLITFNLKNCSITDRGAGDWSSGDEVAYGIYVAYLNTINNFENVTIDCDWADMKIGTIFATPTAGDNTTSAVFNISHSFVRSWAAVMYSPMLGGQGAASIYNIMDSTLTTPAVTPGGAGDHNHQFLGGGYTSRFYFRDSSIIGRLSCYGMGLDNQFLDAERCVFDFGYTGTGGCGYAINAPRYPLYDHKYTNCAYIMGGTGTQRPYMVYSELWPAGRNLGKLTLIHCTVSNSQPTNSALIHHANANADPLYVELDNCILALAGTSNGVRTSGATKNISGTTGSNLRYYAGSSTTTLLVNDALTRAGGTIVDVSELIMASDGYHLDSTSVMADQAPDIGINDDIDGDVRPAGPDPAQLLDPGDDPDLPEFGCDERADLPPPIPPASATTWYLFD